MIAIIDAELLHNGNHRFPNLASMKLSGYYKRKGFDTKLIMDYNDIRKNTFEKIFISKVFTETIVPKDVLELPNVEYGGTGFFFDKAPALPNDIEHSKPDYDLYNDFVNARIANGEKKSKLQYYTDYSWGFLTRGCIRQCPFCVLQNTKVVVEHSPVKEFYSPTRKYIGMLDDNFLAFKGWKEKTNELLNYGKPVIFKQGLDIRLMTEEKAELLSKLRYQTRIKWAFDNIADRNIIEKKTELWRKYYKKECLYFVLVAFDREDKWDDNFWKQDIIDAFTRVHILMQHGQFPYIMRFNRFKTAPTYNFYVSFAAWNNQIQFFHKKSFREFLILAKKEKVLLEMETKYPEIVKEFFDLKYLNYNTK